MEEYGCYTMGITKAIPVKLLNRFLVYYSYSYKGKVYSDCVFQRNNGLNCGARFLVYVDAKHPHLNHIDFTHQVTPAELRQIVSAPYPHHFK
jgi:hypothetical protein